MAGGGGGGHSISFVPGGGGGAGELIYQSKFTASAETIIVSVGAGGLANLPGGDTAFSTLVSKGGGYGGGRVTGFNGGPGGSGGGARRGNNGSPTGFGGASTKTIGLGNVGGNSIGNLSLSSDGGGGGGALGAGSDGGKLGSSSLGTPGGAGYLTTISGTSQTYAIGGRGGIRSTTRDGASAALNTGNGGGGGSSAGDEMVGGSGGSGIVIVRYQLGMFLGPATGAMRGIFTSTPNGLTVDQAAVSGFALKQGYPGYGDGTYWIKPTSGSVAGLAFVDMTTDGGGWTLAYETVTATRVNNFIVYSVNNSSNLASISFKRVAYSMNNFNSWAFTSFDSWSSAVANHRVAAPNDAFVNQRRVYNLNIVSSNTNIITGTGLYGALEIWPSNYGANRNTSIGTYGSDGVYDINDSGANTGNGYGCFQVHDITNLRPVICWNNHGVANPDIGFGPQSVGNPDWTFTNKGATSDFRVRVFVR